MIVNWWFVLYVAIAVPIAFKYLTLWKATHQNDYFNSMTVPPALELLTHLFILVVAFFLAPLALADLILDYRQTKKGGL